MKFTEAKLGKSGKGNIYSRGLIPNPFFVIYVLKQTNRPADLPTYRPTYRPTYLPTHPPTHLPTHLPTYLPTYVPTYMEQTP